MNQASRQHAEKWGREAEAIATEYLRGLGYVIREQRWTGGGHFEVDIIAQQDDTIILVEVKARKENSVDPVDTVDETKMRRLVIAADSYIGRLSSRFYYRFDIVAITGSSDSYTLRHIPDAFLSPIKKVR